MLGDRDDSYLIYKTFKFKFDDPTNAIERQTSLISRNTTYLTKLLLTRYCTDTCHKKKEKVYTNHHCSNRKYNSQENEESGLCKQSYNAKERSNVNTIHNMLGEEIMRGNRRVTRGAKGE